MSEHRLVLGDYRGFTPSDTEEEGGVYGGLAVGAIGEGSGDSFWKPNRRLVITGPLCTCKVHEPVGTSCMRHDGTYKPPTKNPRQTVIVLTQ